MPQCPLCHGTVKDDFGLQECLSCGAQLLVHMDGHVEYKGAEQAEPEPEADSDFAEAPRPHREARKSFLILVPPSQSQAGFRLPEEEVNLPPEHESFIIGHEKKRRPPRNSFKTIARFCLHPAMNKTRLRKNPRLRNP